MKERSLRRLCHECVLKERYSWHFCAPFVSGLKSGCKVHEEGMRILHEKITKELFAEGNKNRKREDMR